MAYIMGRVSSRKLERAGEQKGREDFFHLYSSNHYSLPPFSLYLSRSPSMDLEEGPTFAAPSLAAAVALGSSPPTHDLESTPIGSPEGMVPAYIPPPSDEDHDNDLDHDSKHEDDRDHGCGHDKDHDDQSTGPSVVLTDDLKSKIIKQAEYYFSDENLPTDKYMMSLIKKNKEGFVPISVIASFRKMKKLTRYYPSIVAALKESFLLVVSADGKKVKRLNPLPFTNVRDPKLFTVLVENLPEDHSVENIRKIFGEAGNIKSISIRDPHATEESKKSIRAEILLTTRLHALVEYETEEAAERAVATLNNDQDWRNGLRVKLLKGMGKHGQRRHAWRAPNSEKNVGGRASAQTVDEENNFNGQHDDTPNEEEGDHPPKEKNGHRGRNRGRPKRRGTNGLGHGSTSSHATEISKPPPGPRMPDGTRGFTMGRGRPPLSNQS